MRKIFFVLSVILVSPLLLIAVFGFMLLIAFNGISANNAPESKDEYYGRI